MSEPTIHQPREGVEHWSSYASDYFKGKWDLAGDLARLRAALTQEQEPTDR